MKPDAPRLLADAFAAHAVDWAKSLGATTAVAAAVRLAAREVSLATSAGHVCTHLDAIAADGHDHRGGGHVDVDAAADVDANADADGNAHGTSPRGASSAGAQLRAQLLASGIVGTPDAPSAHPLIVDDEGRLYLHRYFDYERRLARRLLQPGARHILDEAALKTRLADLFDSGGAQPDGRPDWQKLAAANALLGHLTVISGGPGTGKTTTVVNLLACLLEQDAGCRIALAAPTGKAAARMIEAIRLRAARLPEALRARLPQEAHTIHRLLGVTPDNGRFRHDARNPLAIDALVVDEASMLDLALAAKLFEAVPPSARIILLGDKDQLAAVESGAVFAELGSDPRLSGTRCKQLAALCGVAPEALQATAAAPAAIHGLRGEAPEASDAPEASQGPPAAAPAPSHESRDAAPDLLLSPAPAATSGLRDSVVWFNENFRFAKDSGIGRLAADINAGRAAEAVDWLASRADEAVCWIDDGGETPGEAALNELFAGYAPYLDAVRHFTDTAADAAAVIEAFDRFRILCAVRQGERGVEAINRVVARHFRRRLDHPPDHPLAAANIASDAADWYPGRPVMVLQNDYVLKLYNGDIGIVLPTADGTLDVCFADRELGVRRIAPVRMPAHETAFAMTVHKAQGSEFDAVLLMLPAAPNRVLTRELLYTAVTRARRRVVLVGTGAVLSAAIAARTQRHSGLLARLAEAQAALD